MTSETAARSRPSAAGRLPGGLATVARAEVAREAWDGLATASDDAWLWHVYDIQEALATWHGATDRSFALVDGDGRPLAIVPLVARSGRRLRGAIKVVDVLSTGGPAVDPEASGRVREKVLEAAVRHAVELGRTLGAGSLEAILSPLAPALRAEHLPRVNPLVQLGFENTLTQTWMVDLRDGPGAVWDGMRTRARTEIRKAEREGVEVRAAAPGDLDSYYRLHVETYERTGARPHPRGYFERIFSDFVPTGRALILLAELHGEVVAARNFGLCKQAGWYWTGAASKRGLEVGAGSLLHWEGMKRMVEQGCEWSETGEAFPNAADPKSRGLTLHKESFGGELYPLYRGKISLHRRSAEIADALSRLRAALRR